MKQFRIYTRTDQLFPEGDIAIVDNNFLIVEGTEEVHNSVTQNLRTFLGEWFMDILLGVPYYQLIFDKVTPLELTDSSIKDAILGTKGVVEILKWENLDYESSDRSLKIECVIGTEEDEIPIEVTI